MAKCPRCRIGNITESDVRDHGYLHAAGTDKRIEFETVKKSCPHCNVTWRELRPKVQVDYSLLIKDSPGMLIAVNVKRLRDEQVWTQIELAEKSGLTLETVRRVEAGNEIPKTMTINALASALGVRYVDLLEPVK